MPLVMVFRLPGKKHSEDRSPGLDGDDLMMDYLNGATDNEIAVIGCLAAMVGSLGVMLISGSLFNRTASRGEQSVASGRVRGEVLRPVGPKTVDQEAA